MDVTGIILVVECVIAAVLGIGIFIMQKRESEHYKEHLAQIEQTRVK